MGMCILLAGANLLMRVVRFSLLNGFSSLTCTIDKLSDIGTITHTHIADEWHC